MIRVTGLAALLLMAGQAGSRSPAPADPPGPATRYGPLYRAVELEQVFPDGKTFADATARGDPAAILAAYRAQAPRGRAALRRFVLGHFVVPAGAAAPAAGARARMSLARHIAALWPRLVRPPVAADARGTALALPARFVVPGGRFRELYYWDSYFTMLGLRADGQDALVEAMLDDFVSLVERYGHVPNGTRTYYLGRSQPPVLYLMVEASASRDAARARRRLAALRREHDWWMRPAGGRVVRMPDGAVLNRYGDDRPGPRDESYREDVLTAAASGRPAPTVQRDLRAAAESGWDFSSRWLADGRTLATIRTTRIVPVDLNSLLWGEERAIARGCAAVRDAGCATRFAALARARGRAVERWLWSDAERRYGDWDVDARRLRPGLTAATAFPSFTGLAAPARARAVAGTIAARLVAPGGLRTSLVRTGQQWDAPNGWAPLQWVGALALERGGRPDAARTVAARFVAGADDEYRRSGRLLEKYDVEERRAGGGGEYPGQDGFGWTNGVIRAFQVRYAPGSAPAPPAR